MPSGKDGLPDNQVDMMLKTGLRIPPDPACPAARYPSARSAS